MSKPINMLMLLDPISINFFARNLISIRLSSIFEAGRTTEKSALVTSTLPPMLKPMQLSYNFEFCFCSNVFILL